MRFGAAGALTVSDAGFESCPEPAAWVYRNRDEVGYRCGAHVARFQKQAFRDLAIAGLFELRALEREA